MSFCHLTAPIKSKTVLWLLYFEKAVVRRTLTLGSCPLHLQGGPVTYPITTAYGVIHISDYFSAKKDEKMP